MEDSSEEEMTGYSDSLNTRFEWEGRVKDSLEEW